MLILPNLGNRSFHLAKPLGCALLLLQTAVVAAAAENNMGAGEARKPAWKWTVDERLTHRFSPAEMKSRAAQRKAEEREFNRRFPTMEAPIEKASGSDVDRVDGDKTPELFLPFELFDQLLDMGFPLGSGDTVESRRIVGERAVALGFGQDLWTRLEKVAGSYLAVRRRADAAARANEEPRGSKMIDGVEMDREAIALCRARARAISAAETEFGEEPFHRLLYAGVSAGFSRSYVVHGTSMEDHRRFLKILDGGCR